MISHIWIVPLLPLVAALVVFFLGKRINKLAGILTASTMFFSFIVALKTMMVYWKNPTVAELSFPWLKTAGALNLEAGILLDPLSVLMLVIVTFISLMVQMYSLGYMADDEHKARYFSFISLFTFSMLGLVLANNLVFIYMFWELVGLSSYLLIGFWNHKPEAANAAKKAFIVTRFGDLGFLIGILIVGFALNTFNIIEIGKAVANGALSIELITIIALLIFAGAVGKSAQFPLHIWLPDAMEGPTPVSALIHAATMVAAGVFLVARTFPVFEASPTVLSIVATIGGFTALFSATIACVQDDIKRILAYSTLSQLGYMMMAMGCGGYAAGMFHLSTHAAFKALLFLGAGSVIHAVHTNNIWQMGGLNKTMKITAFSMLVAGLALAGIPPLAGFFSKDAVLLAALNGNRMDLLVVGLITALLTSFYMFRLFFVVFTGKATGDNKGHESPLVMTVPLLTLSLLAIVLGFMGTGLNHFLQTSFGAPEIHQAHHNRLVPMFAFVAAVLGTGWAYLVYYQKAVSAALLERRFKWIYRIVKNKYYIDEMYRFCVDYILFSVAKAFAWFDRHVVDGSVNGVAWICRKSGQGLSALQIGRVQGYMLVFVIGLIVLIVSLFIEQPSVRLLLEK